MGRDILRKYCITGFIPPVGHITGDARVYQEILEITLSATSLSNKHTLDFIIGDHQGNRGILNRLTLTASDGRLLKKTLMHDVESETSLDVQQLSPLPGEGRKIHHIMTPVRFEPVILNRGAKGLTIRVDHQETPNVTLEFTPKQADDLSELVRLFCETPNLIDRMHPMLTPLLVEPTGQTNPL